MSLFPLALPPGLHRAGTQLKSQGRWYDGNLVRFHAGCIMPVGGWRLKSTSTMTGAARAILVWRDNGNISRIGIATHSKIYSMTRGGVLSDITPSGYTAGRANAVAEGGYGDGLYGAGTYGTPRDDSTAIQDATVTSMDTWGEDLVFVSPDDGKIYQWSLSGIGVAVTNAPTATALLTTQEGILMALGAENVPRRVKWSDQRDNTIWTPDATNQAGDFDLQTNGRLMFGLRINGGVLLLTDADMHLATYTADNRVYSFEKKSDGCGAISRTSGIALDSQAVWMGKGNFWLYNGYAQPLPCDVSDYVFADLNYLQMSKVTCELNSEFGEVMWKYPSGGSIEVDSYVTWNFRENHWAFGKTNRLCGADKAAGMQYPLRCDLAGHVYEHEVGYTYDANVMPYLESGPVMIGNGDNVAYVNGLIPDDATLGDVNASIYTKYYPDDSETLNGPYTLASKTDLRLSGRIMRLRLDAMANDDWRVGVPKLDILQGGMR